MSVASTLDTTGVIRDAPPPDFLVKTRARLTEALTLLDSLRPYSVGTKDYEEVWGPTWDAAYVEACTAARAYFEAVGKH